MEESWAFDALCVGGLGDWLAAETFKKNAGRVVVGVLGDAFAAEGFGVGGGGGGGESLGCNAE